MRCVQTLEPLAERTGLSIEVDDRLTEGARSSGVLELLDALPGGAVLCSHGDVIPETIEALVRRGLDVRTPADWRKASVWVLKRNKHGSFTRGRGRGDHPASETHAAVRVGVEIGLDLGEERLHLVAYVGGRSPGEAPLDVRQRHRSLTEEPILDDPEEAERVGVRRVELGRPSELHHRVEEEVARLLRVARGAPPRAPSSTRSR